MSEKKVMISQPMNGLTDEQIKATKEKAVKLLTERGYVIVNSLFEDDWADPEKLKEDGVENIPVAFLGRSIIVMSHCNAVYFCNGWAQARGCRVEHEIAQAYGMDLIYESADDGEIMEAKIND